MSFDSFIATIGGLVGLFMGISLISVFELIELLFQLIYAKYSWSLKQKTLKTNAEKPRDTDSANKSDPTNEIFCVDLSDKETL